MSEDSFERRRREREERRKQREEESKREEEELERQREQRKREREERRRALEAGEDVAPAVSTTAAVAPADDSHKRAAVEEAERRERERAEADKAAAERERARHAEEQEQERERERRRREREQADADAADKARRVAAEEAAKEEELRRVELGRKEEAEAAERAARRAREAEQAEAAQRAERRRAEAAEEDKRKRESSASSSGDAALHAEVARLKGALSEQQEQNADLQRQLRAAERRAADLADQLHAAQSKPAPVADQTERVAQLMDKLEAAHDKLSASERDVAELTAKLAAAKSSASAATTASAEPASTGPRLTVATTKRPSKYKTTRAATSKADSNGDDEDGDSGKSAAAAAPAAKQEELEPERPKPAKSGNAALDLLASTLRGNSSSSVSALKKAGSNVFVSAGTKGGEISRSLFMLKGKVRTRAVRVEDSPASITSGDTFILETKTHIWTYIGSESNRLKIARALDVVGKMQRQRGQARAAILETIEKKSDYEDDRGKRTQFWANWEAGEPASIPPGEDDTEWEINYEAKTNLFRVDAGFELVPVAQGKLMQEQLDGDKIYLLDTPYEMFVWCGKASDTALRKEAVEGAQDMLNKAIASGLKPKWTELERVAEKGEGALFEDKFFKWSDSMQKVIGKVNHRELSNVAISNKKQELPRILSMHEDEPEPLKEYTDDLDGEPEIVFVKDFRRTPLPKTEYGTFFTKHCYILLYRYSDTAVLYYWIGRDSGPTEQGTCASLAKEWAGELGLNRPHLARVDQGKENSHFLSIFKGNMIVWTGEREKGNQKPKSLFHIRGTDVGTTRSFECPDISGVYLNSDDAFVLNTKESQYVWLGDHCSSIVRDRTASYVAAATRGDRGAAQIIHEGSESKAFKDAIGFKAEYARHETRPNNLPVKLFICSNPNKQYRCDQQTVFVQTDLSHDGQAILDRHSEVIVWVGKDCKAEERVLAQEVAVDYVAKADDGRKKCDVWVLDEGEEHVDFTRYFQAWDPSRAISKKKHISVGSPLERSASSMSRAALGAASSGAKYALKQLVDRDYLPEGVDKRKLEEYLRDEDFPEVFNMTAAEFRAMPAWKRLEAKKKSVLF